MSERRIVGRDETLKVLERVVAGAEDFVYRTGKDHICVNFVPNRINSETMWFPSCIVGHVLDELKLPVELREPLFSGSAYAVNDLLYRLGAPFAFSNSALYMLGMVQTEQDGRVAWGVALESAREYRSKCDQNGIED